MKQMRHSTYSLNPVKNINKAVNKHDGLEDEDISHPTYYKPIMQYQQRDKDIIQIVLTDNDYSMKNCHRSNKKYPLIC